LTAAEHLRATLWLERSSLFGKPMAPSVNESPRILIALKLSEDPVPLVISRARAIVQQMTGNAWFPSPDPPLSDIEAAIEDLQSAQASTLMRTKGTTDVRDGKRTTLLSRLEYLKAYVEAIANDHPDNATAIIESAGMHVKDKKGPPGRVFTARPGRVSGEVELVAPRAGDRSAYEFQYSLDGGKTWLPLPEPFTTKATVTVTGLTPGSTAHFRYRATVKGVTGNWSDAVAIIVS
jgi:hypothetical protein